MQVRRPQLGIWFGGVQEWGTDAVISKHTAATDCLLARHVCLVLISCSGLHERMTRCGGWAYTAQTYSDSIKESLVVTLFVTGWRDSFGVGIRYYPFLLSIRYSLSSRYCSQTSTAKQIGLLWHGWRWGMLGFLAPKQIQSQQAGSSRLGALSVPAASSTDERSF